MVTVQFENKIPRPPIVTIAFLSWNRFHYLKATVDSARACICYPNIEWIINDNESVEPGLKEYIESLSWFKAKVFSKRDHAAAMNELVNIATGKYLLLWPDDIQFVTRGEWISDIVEILENNPWIGSVGLNFLRAKTIKQLFTARKWLNIRSLLKEAYFFGIKFRFSKRLRSSRGREIRTLGHVWPGICGSGIPSLTRTDIWRLFGPWRTTELRSQENLLDSSLGAEADMVNRFYNHGRVFQHAILSCPVAADIVTDPIGSKAKIRRGKRYGVYAPPPIGTYYYRIADENRLDLLAYSLPRSFEESVVPLGFALPFDKKGDLLKANYINLDIVEDLD